VSKRLVVISCLITALLLTLAIVALMLSILSNSVINGSPKVTIYLSVTVSRHLTILNGYGISVKVGDYRVDYSRIKYDYRLGVEVRGCGKYVSLGTFNVPTSITNYLVNLMNKSIINRIALLRCSNLTINLVPMINYVRVVTDVGPKYGRLITTENILLAKPWIPFIIKVPVSRVGNRLVLDVESTSITKFYKRIEVDTTKDSNQVSYLIWVEGKGFPIVRSLSLRPNESFMYSKALTNYLIPALAAVAIVNSVLNIIVLRVVVRRSRRIASPSDTK